jgi:hypothetical protein
MVQQQRTHHHSDGRYDPADQDHTDDRIGGISQDANADDGKAILRAARRSPLAAKRFFAAGE